MTVLSPDDIMTVLSPDDIMTVLSPDDIMTVLSPDDLRSIAIQTLLLHPTNAQFCHLIQKTSESRCLKNVPNGQHCTKISSL